MRFSEAIRLGSMTTKPARGIETDGKRACARGAALLAAGFYNSNGMPNGEKTVIVYGSSTARDGTISFGYTRDLRDDAWPTGWRPLMSLRILCPVKRCAFNEDGQAPEIWPLLAHLNDHHRWARARTADWVETIENAIEAEKPAELVPVAVRSEQP